MTEKSSSDSNSSTVTAAQAKAGFLNKKIQAAMEDLRKNRRLNQRRASYIKVATILFSSVVTVLLGLQVTGFEKYFKDTAFTLGALVTLLNAVEPFFNYRALWVEHEAALANMYRLKDDVGFYLEGTPPSELSIERLEQFLQRYKEIWGTLNQNYIRYRKGDVAQQ